MNNPSLLYFDSRSDPNRLLHQPDIAVLQAGFDRQGRMAVHPFADQAVLDAVLELHGGDDPRTAVRPLTFRGHGPDLAAHGLDQLARAAAEEYPALVQDGHVVATLADVFDDVGGQEHRAAPAISASRLRRRTRSSGSNRRWVRPRSAIAVAEKRLGDPDPAFHPAREGAQAALGVPGQAGQFDDLDQLFLPFFFVRHTFQQGHVFQELESRQVGIQAELLGQIAKHGLDRSLPFPVVRSLPKTLTLPAVGRSRPARMRIRVVLPAR